MFQIGYFSDIFVCYISQTMSRTLDNLARDEDAYEEMVEDKQVGMPMFID